MKESNSSAVEQWSSLSHRSPVPLYHFIFSIFSKREGGEGQIEKWKSRQYTGNKYTICERTLFLDSIKSKSALSSCRASFDLRIKANTERVFEIEVVIVATGVVH